MMGGKSFAVGEIRTAKIRESNPIYFNPRRTILGRFDARIAD